MHNSLMIAALSALAAAAAADVAAEPMAREAYSWAATGLDAGDGDPADAGFRYGAWRLSLRYALAVPDGVSSMPQGQAPAALPLWGDGHRLYAPLRWQALGEVTVLPRWRVGGDVDAGRWPGFGVKLRYDLARDWSVAAGYRVQSYDRAPLDAAGSGWGSQFSLGTRLAF